MEATINGKADAWRSRIDEQRASGQSIRAWCKANDVARGFLLLVAGPARFVVEAATAVFQTGGSQAWPLGFAQVVVHPSAAEPLRLRFAGGHVN